jgi:phosphinothricin acetyltransferase
MPTPPADRTDLTIRPATIADVPAITRIYNEGIADRLATLETEERTEEERAAWLAGRPARCPVLVAERAGAVLGWGSLNPFNPRPAYRFVADFSVYVGREARGGGGGGALLDALIAAARPLGYHKLVLAAFPFNPAGMALYRRRGFREVGVYREQGKLDGRWVDVVVMERLLEDGDPPRPTDATDHDAAGARPSG